MQKRQNMLLRIVKLISLKTQLTSEFKDNEKERSGRLSTKCSREERDSKSAAVAIPTDSYSGQEIKTPGIANQSMSVQPTVHKKIIQGMKGRGIDSQSKKENGEQYSNFTATIIPTVSSSSQDGKTPGIGNQATSVQPTVHKKVFQDIKRRGIERQSKNESREEYSNSSATDILAVSSSGQDGKYPRIANQATPVQLTVHKKVFKVSKRVGTDRQSKTESGEQRSTSPATAFLTVSSFGLDGKSPVIAFHATTTQPIIPRIDFRDSKREGVDRQSIMAKERQNSTSPEVSIPTVSTFAPDDTSPVIDVRVTATQPTVHRIDFRDSRREGVNRQSTVAKNRQNSTSPEVAIPTVSSFRPDGISPVIGIRVIASQPTVHQSYFQDLKPERIDKQSMSDSGEQYSRSTTVTTPTVSHLGNDGKSPVIGIEAMVNETTPRNYDCQPENPGIDATATRQSSPIAQRSSCCSTTYRRMVQKRRRVVNMNGNIRRVEGATQKRKYKYVWAGTILRAPVVDNDDE